jgi:hypothetical protein
LRIAAADVRFEGLGGVSMMEDNTRAGRRDIPEEKLP